jgi:branched-chain amino acid transport system permease protein
MLQYVLAGLALGAIYAIASASLVVTFVSAGVLNFAFGAMAFVVARVFYYLHSQQGWPSAAAAAASVLVFAPALGAALYGLLFRHLRTATSLTKIVATIGLSVALPPLTNLVFGTQDIQAAPGLTPTQEHPVKIFGAPVTNDQLLTYGFLALVVVVGSIVLTRTDIGLRVRAMVDSEAMASLSAINPGRISLGVWAVTTALAGLAGILVAPTSGLSVAGMTTLMAAAFAAVVAARLRSVPGAVAVSLAMGVVTDVVQKYLPADSTFAAAIVPSIPFAFILVALVVYGVRAGKLDEGTQAGGPLDHAVRPAQADAADAPALAGRRRFTSGIGLLPLVAVALLPLLLRDSPYWLGLVVLGLAYGVTFLTFTVVTGEGGMLWLSQVVFAGIGALLGAQFAVNGHLPAIAAIGLAAVVAAVVGAVIGLLTIRLGDLYVALVTLTFSLLVETLVFSRDRFQQGGIGVAFPRPAAVADDLTFAYVLLGVFAVFALLIVNLRRSTSGMALRAVRDSERASRTLGLSVVQVKVIVGALAAFVAAVGGGLLALTVGSAQPASYPTFLGLVWLAVVVTLGIRSITAAVVAGLTSTLLPGLFQTYLPTRLGEVPAILFGLGAIAVARHPEGAVVQTGRQLRQLAARLGLSGSHRPRTSDGTPDTAAPPPALRSEQLVSSDSEVAR